MGFLQPPSPSRCCRRRTFLAGVGSGAVFTVGAGPASAIEGEVPRTAVVPAVEEFEGNYAGQFLTIYEPAGDDAGMETSPEDVHEACDVGWPEDATEVHVGQLTDRRSDTPVAVSVPVFTDGREVDLVEDALFVVNSSRPCDAEFVVLDTTWVTTRSLVGKPPGPTVAEGDGDGDTTPGADAPGFGLLGGLAGLAGALLWRLHRGDAE